MNLAAESSTNGGTREGLLLSATNPSGQEPIPGPESHSSGVDLGVEGSACGEGMRAEDVEISSSSAQQVGFAIAETSSRSVGPENEEGPREDVDMEDGEGDHDTRTRVTGVLGAGDKRDSTMIGANAGTTLGPQEGGSDRDVTERDVTMEDIEGCPEDNQAGTAPEPEDTEHSSHHGAENQGDPGADVTMGNAESSAESSAARALGVLPTELDGDDLAGHEPQNPAEPIGTRFSHRLREAVTSAPACESPASPEAPEGRLNEDNRKTPARSGKTKEPATKQKRDPSMPLGLWEIIDVDALVRWRRTTNLIGPDFSSRKTETLLTSTLRNNHPKSRQSRQSLPMTERV